ncbi:hypothetical protein M407DRAFT_27560 [Tulasnella calospora MUT 4182]|uniref:Peptidase A1 domain-containing protein n=1 Tax=Tulasnella calospora MUT 4182 TaxID=1051891 RepID=A0A0C3KNJ8_9AGAM|nr:hypothetical protein M407DRAFT_27560 [Tulasnella calospora MUT 4182]
MRSATIILVLLSSILASASPTPALPETASGNDGPEIAKRGASVVHFRRGGSRSTTAHGALTNVHLAQMERARIRWKWRSTVKGRSSKVAQVAHKVGSNIFFKRNAREMVRPFDIKEKRDGSQGTDPMISDWEGFDNSYSGKISVGTPYQETTVQFDTGSSDLVLPASSCASCIGPLFDPSKSSTFEDSEIPYSITYEDDSGASGVLVTDRVAVAGLEVPQQTFAAVSSETEGFADPYAGILGLGFLPNAASNSTPFFANLVEAGSLFSNVFSFYMTRGGVEGSELCLGCVNSGKFTGVGFYPVVTFTDDGRPFDWDIQSTGMSYEGPPHNTSRRHKAWKSEGFLATIDSGTTFIYVSKKIAKALYDQIPNSRAASEDWGEGSYAFPCDSVGDIGTISFGFGNEQYAIDPRDFNAGPESDGSEYCVGGIFGDDLWEGIAILGDAFMKNWYSVFEYTTPAIGFAKAI